MSSKLVNSMFIFTLENRISSPHGVVANILGRDMEVSEF